MCPFQGGISAFFFILRLSCLMRDGRCFYMHAGFGGSAMWAECPQYK